MVVTHRNRADITRCLKALEKAAPAIGMEVIVVDNASGDGTAEAAQLAAQLAAQSAALRARVIERTVNGGFADGCRLGAAGAHGRWLLFLNPDTAIAKDAIGALLGCAQNHPSAGIVGGRFVHAGWDRDPRSWWRRPTPWSALCFALGLCSLLPGSPMFDPESARPWTSDPGQERVAPVVSGAFMPVKRELWEELDGFDSAFFMYAEDADFCLRAAARGYRPMVTARAVCQHEGGKSRRARASWFCSIPARSPFPAACRARVRGPASACCSPAFSCAPPQAGLRARPHRRVSDGRPLREPTGGRSGPRACGWRRGRVAPAPSG